MGREIEDVPGYSEEIAVRILEHLQDTFPAQNDLNEMKRLLVPVSEQRDFLIAMNALLKLGLISGKTLMSQEGLAAAMDVNISQAGRDYLQRRNQPVAVPNSTGTTIHGNQIVTYGSVGAIGQNSTGTVNTFTHCWARMESEVDLKELGHQLEILRMEFRKSATTRQDDVQLGLLAEAEDAAESNDGPRVLKALSSVGRAILETAERIGTDIAAKVIVEAGKGL